MVIIIGFNYSRPAQVAENLKIQPCRADKWNSAESGIFCRWWTSGTPARGLGHAWIEADVCAGRIAVPDSLRCRLLPHFRIQPLCEAGGAADADRKSTRLNSSHATLSRMPSSA